MKKEKILAAGLAGCAFLLAGIGWTVALFAEQRESVSAAAMEPVQLDVCFLSSKEKYTEEQITGLLPGETVEREPAVILDGTSPEAYVRVRLTFGGILGSRPKESAEERDARLTRIRELQSGIRFCDGWLEGEDGYYYYQQKVMPGSILPVYERVTIPEGWDNEIAEKLFTIELSAEAVRSDCMEPWLAGAGEIRNWE